MLIIMSGLPGTGKSTLAKGLARELGAAYVRIDSIEQTLLDSDWVDTGNEMGPAGYEVGYAVSLDNLKLGLKVIADSVNPISNTREAWTKVGLKADVSVIDLEVICSEQDEHRKRVEERPSEVDGLKLPTWEEVINREYHAWEGERLVVDTAGQTTDESIKQAISLVQGLQA